MPDFVGADNLPLSGREEQWGLVTDYRVRLAMEARNWAEAERLQRVQVDEQRRRAMSLLARPVESLGAGEKNTLRTLAVFIEQLGHIQREQDKPECANSYKETIPVYQQIGDKSAEAVLRLQPRTRLQKPARPAEFGRSRALVSSQFGITCRRR